MSARVLVVDDDPEMIESLRRQFEADGHAVTGAVGGRAAIEAVGQGEFDVVVTDLVMDGVDGLAVLRAVQRTRLRTRVILMTAFASLDTAIEAMRAGAHDYLRKPFRLGEASLAVNRALDDQRLREENRRLWAQVGGRFGTQGLLGQSPAIRAVLEQAESVAETDAPVLLLGESGTGKELVARIIHQVSARRDHPFVAVNCAAIPEALLESELFGHERGAFTGADRRRRGLFAEANLGTLFLDEIGDIPPLLQAKLLRALQERSVRPVGGNQEVRLDLRVISATNQDLSRLMGAGKFREDLYYRLAVIPVRLPALRERPGDIGLLATHFLDRAAARLGKPLDGFDDAATAWLHDHRWPGNVRELENIVERAATLTRGPRVTRADLRVEFTGATPGAAGARPTLLELETQYMRRVLEESGGDKRAAARVLGVSVRTLQRRLG